MSFFDIIIGGLLAYSLFKGIRNGLFLELSSFLSLILGIYIAIQFSDILKNNLSSWLNWNPYTLQLVAFILTFILVVIGIHLLGKFMTGLANFAFLGWANSFGGGLFRVLKTVLMISVFLTIFEKINYNNFLAKKETLDKSIFFSPVQKTATFIFPSLERWYEKVKK